MPAAAHSAGSSTRLADAADVGSEAAEDGANPKVTVLPSATPTLRAGRIRGSAHATEPYLVGGQAVRVRPSILPVELGCGNEQLGQGTVIG